MLSEDDPQRDFFSRSIREREKKDYDFKTIFFDAVRFDDSVKIHLFAPPMLNLLSELGNPVFYISGKKCRSHRKIGALGKFEEWILTPATKEKKDNDLKIVFPKGNTYWIKLNILIPLPKGSRILTAIQKNNNIRWIKDWYNYYKRTFSVSHLVLYDNNSENIDELESSLPDGTILVNWNFPYGPSISHDNKFSQIGALNHCRLTFGAQSEIFSFDIDEILVDTHHKLEIYFSKFRVHYFSSFFVPYISGLPENYSFSSFTSRNRSPVHTGKKYVYHAGKSTGVLPHYVDSHRIRFLDNLTILIKKGINSILWKNDQKTNLLIKVLNIFLKIMVLGKRQKNYKINEVYFLHFKGITTNWKNRGNRFSPDKTDNLVLEKSLINWVENN